MDHWHCLVDGQGRSGAHNMALDDALLRDAGRTGRTFLRLYRWSPACLSLGRNEPALVRYDRATIERRGIDVVRRPTGGRAVWHDDEVTYAVAAPVTVFGSLAASYAEIHTRLAAALRTLGVSAELAPARRVSGLGAGACFSAPVGGEVTVLGRKVIGSAQVRLGSAFLQHGSILLGGSQAGIDTVSRQPSAVSSATSLSEALARPVTFAEVAQAIVATWGSTIIPAVPYRPLPSASMVIAFGSPRRTAVALCSFLLAFIGCTRRAGCRGEYCGTVVFAATGEATTLLPPVTSSAVDRDVFDQIFLKLADIGPAGGTFGDSGFTPQLARSWEWNDPRTLTFHLDPRARWQDGSPVTAADVAFTFDAYTDSVVNADDRTALSHITSVAATDSLTVVFRFRDRYPEMFYDATYHMRILPAHLLRNVPRAAWQTAAFGHTPVGDGPYRLVRWTPGESLELAADSTFFLGRPHLRRLIWRFAGNLNNAVTMVLAAEADAVEVLVTPANIMKAKADSLLTLYPYAGSTYTFVRFNLRANGDPTHPHPIFADPDVRRALVLATDRPRMVQAVFGEYAKVPPGPMPQQWSWLWTADLVPTPADSAQAERLLATHGWHDSDGDGFKDHAARRLSFHLSVPSTSPSRVQYAQLLQEQLRHFGVEVVIDQVDNPTLQQLLESGKFDSALESFVTDPTPSSSVPALWGRGGATNFGHYANGVFDRMVATASAAPTRAAAQAAWATAFTTLEQDPPGIMLYALDNVAAVNRRVADVRIRPDSWWGFVRTWRIPPDQLTERDRAER
jgi:ABC-type transport system substrate-binding protein